MLGFAGKRRGAEDRQSAWSAGPEIAQWAFARRVMRHVLALAALLLASLVPQALFAAPAAAADWVLNLDDTGYDPTAAGGTVVYSITVGNGSPVAAGATTVSLTVPATTSFTGGTGSITGCTPVPATGVATVTCQVPALSPGQEV